MAKLAFVEKSKGEYWDRLNAGVYNTAKQRGDEVRIYSPETVDASAQLKLLKKAIDDGADSIVVVSSDQEMFAPEIKRALSMGIPVITMDLDGYVNDRLFYFGTIPYTELGRMAAEEMLKCLKKDGPVIAQAGSYALGASGKLKGFCDRMEEAGRRIILIEPDFEHLDVAFSRAIDTIKANPDVAGIYGVYAYHCDLQAQAMEQLGRNPAEIPIVGFDMLDETVRRLKDGSIAASIWIAEYNFGTSAAMAAGLFASCPWQEVVEFLGGSFENRANNIRRMPVKCFTHDNISEYESWLETRR